MVRKSTSVAPVAAAAASASAPSSDIPSGITIPAKKVAASKKSTAVKAAAPIVEASTDAPIADAPIADAPMVATDSNTDILLKFVEFNAKLQNLSSQLSATRAEFKLLEKQATKELKRKVRGKKKLSGNRAPSGFVKPTKITDELAEFLGKPVGVEMARTEVSKEINNYIKQHNLKDPENGRNINPDIKLKGLLKLGKEDKLTYFNLQKYMKHHFLKESSGVSVSTSI